MNDPTASSLNARLLNLINTGFDSEKGIPSDQVGNPKNINGSGRAYVNSLYPDEIEYYAAALELVDGDGFTEEFFSFPVMFKSYRENKINNTDIEKTMAGVVVTTNPTFVPFDIYMTGNFGRKFKKINTDIPSNQPKSTGSSTAHAPVIIPVFSTEYKTGYGCYKILERIILKSQRQDINYKPYLLFFYNLALNSNYLVECISIEPNQNRENSNMIWEYNLHFKAVAMASSVKKNYKSSLKLITDFNNLTQENVFQASEIEQYKKDRQLVDKQESVVEKILRVQAQSIAYSLTSSYINAVHSLIDLADNPTQAGVFALNIGTGILKRF